MRYGMLFDLNRCVGCNSCAVACSRTNHTTLDHFFTYVDTSETGTYPHILLALTPHICQHCSNAPCVKACPTGASHYDEDGTVQIEAKKCIGCRMCIAACPYHARYFNWGKAEENSAFPGQGLTPWEKSSTIEHQVGVVEKCTFCKERRVKGEGPACVETCGAHARTFGDLDDPASEISRLIVEKKAQPRLSEFGTRPNVYYIGLN